MAFKTAFIGTLTALAIQTVSSVGHASLAVVVSDVAGIRDVRMEKVVYSKALGFDVQSIDASSGDEESVVLKAGQNTLYLKSNSSVSKTVAQQRNENIALLKAMADSRLKFKLLVPSRDTWMSAREQSLLAGASSTDINVVFPDGRTMIPFYDLTKYEIQEGRSMDFLEAITNRLRSRLRARF